MAQTKLKKKQYKIQGSSKGFSSSVTHDYSSLGAGAEHINDGSSDFETEITLNETSDVLIECSIILQNTNQYGCHFYLWRYSGSTPTNVEVFADMGKRGQAVDWTVTTIISIDENVPAGTYTYELLAGASGSTGTSVVFKNRNITLSVVDKQ